MKYLNDLEELNSEFVRLMEEYENYYWMVAWAGEDFHLIANLLKNADKIKQIVVGLHFYQTSPAFIEKFNPVDSVRFIKKTSGIFHPKVYLFVNDGNEWEVLIGSANLTRAAFNRNNEACLLLSSAESDTEFFQKVKDSINASWHAGAKLSAPEFEDYKVLAGKTHQSDDFDGAGGNINPGLYQGSPIVRMNWREYMDRIFQGGYGRIMERITLLDIVSGYFRQYPTFGDMPASERKQVGGYVSVGQSVNFRLFGSMQRAYTFKSVINRDPTEISNALDAIPATGLVTEVQYRSFVQQFRNAVGVNTYRSATRLLAMKRPDIFFAISNGNNQLLAADFQVEHIEGINFDRYWNEIATVIWQAQWWLHPTPLNETERRIVPYRAAFMDVLYYQPR